MRKVNSDTFKNRFPKCKNVSLRVNSIRLLKNFRFTPVRLIHCVCSRAEGLMRRGLTIRRLGGLPMFGLRTGLRRIVRFARSGSGRGGAWTTFRSICRTLFTHGSPIDPARAAAQDGAAANVLLDPFGAPADRADRLQPAVPLVCRAGAGRPGLGRFYLLEEPQPEASRVFRIRLHLSYATISRLSRAACNWLRPRQAGFQSARLHRERFRRQGMGIPSATPMCSHSIWR